MTLNRTTPCLLLSIALSIAAVACSDDAAPSDDTSTDVETDAGSDTATDTASDTGGGDAAPLEGCDEEPGGFGCECDDGDDCDSGVCLATSWGAMACSSECEEGDCPDGWACESVGGGTMACVEIYNLCTPCRTNSQCQGGELGADGDRCVVVGDEEGAFCGQACGDDDDCPTGYGCETVDDVDGDSSDQCVPDSDVCGCTLAAIDDGSATDCFRGACGGERVCSAGGLSDCNAPTESAEVCDGDDNNCDGETDEGFDDLDEDDEADCVDDDDDGDTVDDDDDNCPAVANPGQEDADGDDLGNHCDLPDAPVVSGTTPASPSNQNDFTVQGTAEKAASVQLHSDDQCDIPVGNPVDADATTGAFSIALSVTNDSTTTLYASAANEGGTSPCSTSSVTYHEISSPPSTPTITGTIPTSPSPEAQPHVTGSADANSTVSVFAGADCDGAVVGSGSAADFLSAGIQATTGITPNDTTVVRVTSADALGNVSSCSDGFSYTHDDQTPGEPTLTSIDPEGGSDDPTPTVVGTAEIGAFVSFHATDDCSDDTVGTGTADGSGNYAFDLTVASNAESDLYARATDAAGNDSPCSDKLATYTHDDEAPAFDADSLTVSVQDTDTVLLEWTQATDSLSAQGAITYEVCSTPLPASRGGCDPFAAVDSVTGAGSLSVTVPSGVRQWYGVLAIDEAGNESGGDHFADEVTPSTGVVTSVVGGVEVDGDDVTMCVVLADGGVRCMDSSGQSLYSLDDLDGVTHLARADNEGDPDHWCSRHADGTAYCWGNNSGDHMRLGEAGDIDTPAAALVSEHVLTIAPAAGATCASYFVDDASPNRIRCWGAGYEGADEEIDSALFPTSNQVHLPMSQEPCVIGPGGYLFCWTRGSAAPRRIASTTGSFVDIEWLISDVSLGLRANGFVNSFEFEDADVASVTPVTGLSSIMDLAAAGDHYCVVGADGEVACKGRNDDDQLTDNTPSGLGFVDTGVINAVSTGLGSRHSCAALANGRVSCWGRGFGATPALVGGVDAYVAATGVATGGGSSCLRRSDGRVACWGGNDAGQLGVGAVGPARPWIGLVSGIPDAGENTTPGDTDDRYARAVSVGGQHACAILSDGAVGCWGSNASGQLGLSTDLVSGSAEAGLVPSLSNVRGISAGANHTCVVRGDGTVRCWGANESGQLGNNTTEPSATPVQATGMVLVHQVEAGADFTCARDFGAEVECWGDGFSNKPSLVSGVTATIDLAVGDHHACALFSDGSAKCWGENDFGQLGRGDDEFPGSKSQPVDVIGIDQMVQIAAGSQHTCALRSDGSVWCWGANAAGQLGDDTTTPSIAPVEVEGMGPARSIAAGGDVTCAVIDDGSVRCWGANDQGQVGDDTTESRSVATPVSYFP